ncbi:MAG: DUF192 domain-containing protein [Gammaproteobacteria bacterium]
MIRGRIENDNGESLINQVSRTESVWERMRGLLARPALSESEALWITPCNSVHSFFMQYSLDLVYLNRRQAVVKVVTDLPPGRFSAALGAHSVVELASGAVETLGISVGTQLVWRPCGAG